LIAGDPVWRRLGDPVWRSLGPLASAPEAFGAIGAVVVLLAALVTSRRHRARANGDELPG
jgi:hypothetical protein